MATEVRLNLFGVKNRLEKHLRREVSIVEIAEGMGVNKHGLYKAYNGDTGAVSFETLGKLLEFFRGHGLEIEVGDLFIVEEGTGERNRGEVEPADLAYEAAAVA